MYKMDVSIIIVNYNTCTLVHNCLKSIFEQTKGIDFEVIVSDNGSKDGSIEMIKQYFPQVILIENNANLGFGAANNRGLKIANGKYVFYLNSDTILLNNAIKIFFDYWENSLDTNIIGALGSNLLNEKGEIIHSYGLFPKSYKEIWKMLKKTYVVWAKLILKFLKIDYTKYTKTFIYEKHIGLVDYITGADLFVRNNELAYYDERYFLYFEETHLQWQMMKKGLKRLIIDNAKIVHLNGGSDSKAKDGRLDDYVSFGAIQFDLSRIKFIKYNISAFIALILKVQLYFFWLIPCFRKKTYSYRNEIWKI